jgi:hypothetical protein
MARRVRAHSGRSGHPGSEPAVLLRVSGRRDHGGVRILVAGNCALHGIAGWSAAGEQRGGVLRGRAGEATSGYGLPVDVILRHAAWPGQTARPTTVYSSREARLFERSTDSVEERGQGRDRSRIPPHNTHMGPMGLRTRLLRASGVGRPASSQKGNGQVESRHLVRGNVYMNEKAVEALDRIDVERPFR